MKAFLISLLVLIGFEVNAIEIKSGENVIISRPLHEDLYVTGGTVVINAPIFGDLIAAGGTITLNDSIAFDLMAAGGEIFVNGYVGDDIRMAGGKLHLSSDVGGDVVVTGGTINIARSVHIKGSLFVGGGTVTVDGIVDGQLKAGVGMLTLNGTIKKDADCRGGKLEVNGEIFGKSVLSANEIKIGPAAEFHDDVRYWNKAENLSFNQSIKNGHSSLFDPDLEVESGRWHYLGFATVFALIGYLGAALIMIALIEYWFGQTLQKAASTVLNETLKSLGVGLLYFVATPIAFVICFMTIVGIPLGLILLAIYLFTIMLAIVITSTVTANWLNNIFHAGKWSTAKLIFVSFAIFIALKLFSLTPFVGFPITALMLCMALGAVLINIKLKKQQVVSSTP